MRHNEIVKVLIADDSRLVRKRLIAMLAELSGVEIVGEAEDGLEATEKIRELGPDVVILDIRMPKANGIAVLQDIRKGEHGPIVIILTNYPWSVYKERCMKAGADFFFDKSREFEEVGAVIQEMVRQPCT
jgi:DNA-binding NarL/FixJ family response regulator